MMKKIKILRIITRLNIGGPAQNVILLSEGFNNNDFNTLLITGLPSNAEGDMTYLAKYRNIRLHVIRWLCRELNLIADLIALCKIFYLILKEKPDIVHTHTAKAGALGRIAAVFARVPIKVHTFHGHVLHSYFGKIQTKIFIWVERFLAYFTNKIIAVSPQIKDELLNFGIGNYKKIVVINLGLELEDFLSINANKEYNSPVNIGIIGRLVPIKNHRLFIDAAKKNLCEYDDTEKLRFFIVGSGELELELKRYVKELCIESNVIFTGWQKDLKQVYNKLDVVALTSLNEGTPVSLIEAMASAKAVITTDIGGVRALLGTVIQSVANGDSSFNITERGILVKSGDSCGFSSALRFLLQNPDIRFKMGQAGKEFVRSNFGKERLINDMKNIYTYLLKGEA